MTDLFTVSKTGPINGYSAENAWGDPIQDESKCMTYNAETGKPLGVVGMDYNIMQPQECYNLVERVTGNVPEVKWDGSKMIMQAKMGPGLLLPGDDQVLNMFTIINSFDGTSALSGLGLSFRLVCSNQLRQAFSEAARGNVLTKIKHIGNFDQKLEEFRDACDAIAASQEDFGFKVRRMVQQGVSSDNITELWKKVAPKVLKLTADDMTEERQKNTEARLTDFVNACTNTFEQEVDAGMPPSAWLAGNAVTKYIQHAEAKRGRKADKERRYIDNAIGSRASLSAFVMTKTLELCS